MQKTDEFIVNRLKWKSEKFGLPTKFAKYFEDLSPDLKSNINHQINLEHSGTPVILFTTQSKVWTLVCSKQVIWSDCTMTFSLNLSDITQILPTTFDQTLIGQSIDIEKIKKKSEWESIKLIDRQGNSNILYADKGSDLFSLWNILLMAKQLYA